MSDNICLEQLDRWFKPLSESKLRKKKLKNYNLFKVKKLKKKIILLFSHSISY